MKLSDFKGIFKTADLTIDSVENVFDDYYVLDLRLNDGMTWSAGEHGLFTLPYHDVEGRKMRPFSVASIPEEGVIKIGFRTGEEISSFKNNIINFKQGDKVRIRGPFGWFKIQDEKSPLVFIAGGVGITPFRAIMKELEKSNKRKVEVVYSSPEKYLFEDDLKKVVEKDENIRIHFTTSSNETQNKIKDLVKEFGNDAYYYISGSPKMIKTVKQQVKAERVRSKRIVNDSFMGY